jgi:endonuclease/exonuclease/phosphatase family metal-dependent hydrolase
VHCFVVHLGLLARSRSRQLQVLIDWIQREVAQDAPVIIAGDFNDWRSQLNERLCGALGVSEVFDVARRRERMSERVAHFVRDRLRVKSEVNEIAPQVLPRMVRTARTFPALVPWFRMDRIYTRGFRVESAQVLRGPRWAQISDHSPLIADLILES